MSSEWRFSLIDRTIQFKKDGKEKEEKGRERKDTREDKGEHVESPAWADPRQVQRRRGRERLEESFFSVNEKYISPPFNKMGAIDVTSVEFLLFFSF
jgi:hypothetical protein